MERKQSGSSWFVFSFLCSEDCSMGNKRMDLGKKELMLKIERMMESSSLIHKINLPKSLSLSFEIKLKKFKLSEICLDIYKNFLNEQSKKKNKATWSREEVSRDRPQHSAFSLVLVKIVIWNLKFSITSFSHRRFIVKEKSTGPKWSLLV